MHMKVLPALWNLCPLNSTILPSRNGFHFSILDSNPLRVWAPLGLFTVNVVLPKCNLAISAFPTASASSGDKLMVIFFSCSAVMV